MRYEASAFDFDEKIDLELIPAWFVDTFHSMAHLDFVSLSYAETVTHGICWAAEELPLPRSKGLIWRAYKGGLRMVITPKVVESETEVRAREERMEAKVLGLIDEFGPKWEMLKSELLELYRPLKEFDRKKASPMELAKKLSDLYHIGFRMCEVHFWGMYTTFCLFSMFKDFCDEVGIDTKSEGYGTILRGLSNKSFECESELWQLSRSALDLNLASIFASPKEEVISKLQKEGKGKIWLDKFNGFLNEYGWRCEVCWWPSSPCWIEQPEYVIPKIQQYLKLKELPPVLKATEEDLEKKRSNILADMLSKISDDKKGVFMELLKGARYADVFSEEHDLYCEMQTDALIRVYVSELARRFVETGTIDKVDDIFYLGIDEIRKTANWPEKLRLQSVVEERKALEKAYGDNIPPVLTAGMTFEEAFGYMMKAADPVQLYAIVGEMPKPRPELKADVLGNGGSPGVAEGFARVVFTADQLSEVQQGEILVCPTTSISWTPTFSLIKGIVVDRGGVLSHAAVVSRQFGIPSVLNTFVGTQQIKTGQKIKIDGSTGAVYIIDKE